MLRPHFGPVERLDIVLIGTVLVLAGVAIAMVAFPSLQARVMAPALDLALDTVAFVVTSSVAVLAWVRYRERREPFALFQSAAFLTLAMAQVIDAVVEVTASDVRSPLSIVEPGQDLLYLLTAAQMLSAVLLVVGGVVALHGRQPSHPRLIVATPAVVIIGLVAWVNATGGSLPDLITPIVPSASQLPQLAWSVTSIGVMLQILMAVLFGMAAVVCRALWQRDRAIGDAYVTFGLVLASFAQLIGAISPGTHPGPVAIPADLLRLGFAIALLLAIEAEARSVLTSLRRANQRLELLRDSEIERAALEERAWLSRELHDGLAQDLWLAKLKIGRLSGLDHSPEARALVDEVSGVIELALAEARQAVMALRIAAESEDTFAALMARYVDDFEDRFGLRVDFVCSDDLPTLPVRTQAEFLRIAQEALANAHHHADATIVRVTADAEGGRFRLSVADNGRGFDQTAARPRSFGLAAMRERAVLIGAELQIASAPGDGTRVLVTAPLAVAPARLETR